MASGVFVTGTDTEIGKTWTSVGLIAAFQDRGETVVGMKPISAGCEITAGGLRNDDAVHLQRAGSVPMAYERVNPYAFEPPVSPHVAAARAGVTIDLRRIVSAYRQLASEVDRVVVEGAGGWHAPLGAAITVADMARALELPVIMVVGLRLGCLNHALLTARAIEEDGLELAGWVANELTPDMAAAAENVHHLSEQLKAPLLGVVPYLREFDPRRIAAALDVGMLSR
ncbi:dethiobiotin synthase [Thiohalomonas denitrificans]|uniref:ATP-dependent dethiobiotin synthetase BioD n=1 Tax=Thiohalomonas denitrificans TaxID=415747 RepID=A0A1G5PV83_9GAMM|nr:dethiobiotin synthase [Thiohalomonas denitrificans]SCZ53318.1 dethiobiotin synthetase [Thiohalomonas denitrificans]